MIQAKMPGNNHNVVLGMKNAKIPIINAAAIILTIETVGALVFVNENTK